MNPLTCCIKKEKWRINATLLFRFGNSNTMVILLLLTSHFVHFNDLFAEPIRFKRHPRVIQIQQQLYPRASCVQHHFLQLGCQFIRNVFSPAVINRV